MRIAAFVAIGLTLLLSYPCAATAQTVASPATQQQMDMNCCPAQPALTASSLCCSIHPQPAEPAVQHAPQPPLVLTTALPILQTTRAIPLFAPIAGSASSPPPQLRPILRI
jgi:hypothetical protein